MDKRNDKETRRLVCLVTSPIRDVEPLVIRKEKRQEEQGAGGPTIYMRVEVARVSMASRAETCQGS